MTSFERVKRFLKWAFSGKARKDFRKDLENRKFEKFRLLMLMVVRDEEDIIRQNILFHKEMGVDGFIITSHNSVDRTNIILEDLRKKGVVLDILYKTDPKHQHGVWVKEMITLARDVYHADWVIHADADEFFYSRQQNIKKSIFEFDKWNFNVLKVKAVSLFPDGRNDFLTCPYFVSNFLSPPPPPPRKGHMHIC